MRRGTKHSLGSAVSEAMAASAAGPRENWWQRLVRYHRQSRMKVRERDLAFILRNLATLTQSGVSLPRALGTIADEQAVNKHRDMILAIRRQLENGETFSSALREFPSTFNVIMVNQIKTGEHSGTLPDTLDKIATHCEQGHQLRAEIIRKLAYPVILLVMGFAVITFLLVYVVPVFQETYSKAKVPLPFITQLLIELGEWAKSYGLFLLLIVIVGTVTLVQLRRRPEFAFKMDRTLLRWPVVGPWLRDIAVLQVMEVLGNLMDAGFTLADALGETTQAVSNRAVQKSMRDLQAAVRRGEKFSRELERHGDMFPPIVSQLVIVGEQTGKLAPATGHICEHLQREIQRKTNIFVGALEPTLTIGLAAAVAVILLAIYLPMFDMVNTMAK
jgi:type IV pilus assembly protein PilC